MFCLLPNLLDEMLGIRYSHYSGLRTTFIVDLQCDLYRSFGRKAKVLS